MKNDDFKVAKIDKLICTYHGGNPISTSNFYMATDVSIYRGIGRIPVCKRCIYKILDIYHSQTRDMEMTIYYICRKLDIAYNNKIIQAAINTCEKDDDEDNPTRVFQSYISQYNSLGHTNNAQLPFDDGEHIGATSKCGVGGKDSNKTKKQESDDKIKDEIAETHNAFKDVKMNKDDIAIKNNIIEILGNDPFNGYAEFDQKFLYNDLISYLDDEDVHEDNYLLSQIIQLVNNNNQIRKIDYLISQHTANIDLLIKNEGKVKSLNSLKKDIVVNNDRIAKENRISVRNRRGDGTKKSAITVMMEYLRELDFEDAEIDFYDQKKAYGMQRVADISMKAISKQIQFDENDMNEIVIEQRRMIKDMEEKIMDLEEENRKLLVTIDRGNIDY